MAFVLLLYALNLLGRVSAATPTTLIVAPPGHPSVSGREERGTLNAPFTTLEAARDALRDMDAAASAAGPKHVLLRGGDYYLRNTFTLDARDSGTRAAPIVYRAYPGESPRLTGGVAIPQAAFKPAALPSGAAGGLMANLFDLGLNATTLGGMASPYISRKLELFYGGAPMTLARDPNIGTDPLRTWHWAGYENMSVSASGTGQVRPGKRQWRRGEPFGHEGRSGRLPAYLDWLADVPEEASGNTDSATSFTFKDAERGARWAGAIAEAKARNETSKLWLHGYWKFDWRDTYIRVDSITPVADPLPGADSTSAYTVTRDASTPPQYPWVSGCRFYATNALSLLDQPGEYFVSEATGDLYFIPPAPPTASAAADNAGGAVVSTLASVISATGAAHNHFSGISISTAQSDALVLNDVPGARVHNCTVTNAGGACLAVSSASNASVSDTVVFGCGASGIALEGGDLKTLVPSDSSVLGCHVSDFARKRRTYQPGIAFHGVGMRFANNTVRDAPHAGMTGGGNDLLFEHNVINHTVYECIDAGAFYVGRSWSQRGNVFRNNVIDTVRPTEKLAQASCSQNGFYLDDEMSGWEFSGNTVINATTGLLLGGGRRNNISGNQFTNCDGDVHFDDRGLNWQSKSCAANCSASMGTSCFHASLEALNWQQPPYSVRYPEIVDIYQQRPCTPVFNVIADNTFCHGKSKAGGAFIDRDEKTVAGWGSTMHGNREKEAGC